jgi:DNA polymerase delta subunit 1
MKRKRNYIPKKKKKKKESIDDIIKNALETDYEDIEEDNSNHYIPINHDTVIKIDYSNIIDEMIIDEDKKIFIKCDDNNDNINMDDIEPLLTREDFEQIKKQWKNKLKSKKIIMDITKEYKPNDSNPILFQHIETDYFNTESKKFKFNYNGSRNRQVPVIRLYGVTECGQSILSRIWGFRPYFYIEIPNKLINNTKDIVEQIENINKEMIIKKIEAKMNESIDNAYFINDHQKVEELQNKLENKKEVIMKYVNSIQDTQVLQRTSIWNYQFNRNKKFLKIYTKLPNNVPQLRKILEDGLTICGQYYKFLTYESNILFSLRCMTDKNITPTTWIQIKGGSYELTTRELYKTSLCDIEVDVSCNGIKSYEATGKYQKIAPFKILSYDIECKGLVTQSRKSKKKRVSFPKADISKCPVIQIANIITINGQNSPIIKNCFTLNTCKKIDSKIGNILCFETEEELLTAWAEFVQTIDPDILTGYNVIGFDFPYLFDRAKYLGLSEFNLIGRLKYSKCFHKQTQKGSKQIGKRKTTDIKMYGRCILDVMNFVKQQPNYRLSSYTLNNISKIFLDKTKEDVSYNMIPDLQDTNASTRQRLVRYCIKDALLPQQLIDEICVLINTVEISRVTGIPMSWVWERGQQIRVLSKLLRLTKEKKMVIPTLNIVSESFKGATVLEPVVGLHKNPISVLDFASLYPSIMIAHNLCYTTLIHPKDVKKFKPEDYTKTPNDHYFVKPHIWKGLLPQLLSDLLATRKAVKIKMKTEIGLKKRVLNGRQMALKVCANSIYGFTGVKRGYLPCRPIASSVTSFGREMLEDAKIWIENNITKQNGYLYNARVIYGDTYVLFFFLSY